MYGTGLNLSSTVVGLVNIVNDADNAETFDKAKVEALKGIDTALNDASLDSTERLAYQYLQQSLQIGQYMEPPQTENGVSADMVMASLFSLSGNCVFVIEEFRKLVADAALDSMKNASTDRVYAMAQERVAMQVGYEQNCNAAHAAKQASVVQAVTTMAEGIVSGVIAGASVKYAAGSLSASRQDKNGQEQLSKMKTDLDVQKKAVKDAKKEVDDAEAALTGPTPPTQKVMDKKRSNLKEAEDAVVTQQAAIDRKMEDLKSLQTLAGALNAFAGSLSALSKTATIISAAGNLNASDDTLNSKLDEAVAQFMKSVEGISSTLKQSADESYRNALEMINTVIEFLKEAIPLVSKGPSGA